MSSSAALWPAKIDKPKEDDLINQIENMVMQKSDYTLDPEDGILDAAST